jgi:hypothetical protein
MGEFGVGRLGDGDGDTDVQLKKSLQSKDAVQRLRGGKFGEDGTDENGDDEFEME